MDDESAIINRRIVGVAHAFGSLVRSRRKAMRMRQDQLALATGVGRRFVIDLGACPNSRCSILSESDSTFGYEQVFSALEYRSDAASAAACAGLRAERPCVAVYR